MDLTLIHGDGQQAFAEHPTEVARRALMAASRVETGEFSDQLAQFASTFPARGGAAVAPSDPAAKPEVAAVLSEIAAALSELVALWPADDPLKEAVGQLSLALKQRDRRRG